MLLVNARHTEYVPGRKSDISDAQWIGELLQHGLLKASYIPEVAQRDLRDLIRYRTSLVQEQTRELNQAQPGSVLLSQLSVIGSYFYWLNPVRMVGMAFLFTAITVALTVIIGTLRMQTRLLSGLVRKAG